MADQQKYLSTTKSLGQQSNLSQQQQQQRLQQLLKLQLQSQQLWRLLKGQNLFDLRIVL